MFPFGDQTCSMSFFITGADNKLVNMEESDGLKVFCLSCGESTDQSK